MHRIFYFLYNAGMILKILQMFAKLSLNVSTSSKSSVTVFPFLAKFILSFFSVLSEKLGFSVLQNYLTVLQI